MAFRCRTHMWIRPTNLVNRWASLRYVPICTSIINVSPSILIPVLHQGC